jgi:hypothetical protein
MRQDDSRVATARGDRRRRNGDRDRECARHGGLEGRPSCFALRRSHSGRSSVLTRESGIDMPTILAAFRQSRQCE